MRAHRASMGSSSVPPAVTFICSAAHSGSTLLDLLLGSHPAAMSLGEITQLPKNLALNTACGCGKAVRDCELWSAVVAELGRYPAFQRIHTDPYVLNLGYFEARSVVDKRHQTALRWLRRRLVYAGAFAHWRWNVGPLAGFTSPLRDAVQNKWLLFQAVADRVSRPVLIDSSKHYLEATALYVSEPKRTKVILLVRDGRAVFYSGLKRGWSRSEALNAWRRTYLRALPILSRQISPKDLAWVRYEDLAADPARELHKLCRFIGIGYDDAMLQFRSRPCHVVNGNDMRLRRSAAISVDETWKRALSDADLGYFERRAGSLNRTLGY